MTPTIAVVPIDLDQPGHALLSPILAQRIEAFATKADPFVNASLLAGVTMSQLWTRDRTVRLLALLDGATGEVVGHLLAQLQVNGQGIGSPTVLILQAKADRDVGNAMAEAYEALEAWARAQQAVALVMISGRDPEVLEKKYGFKLSRRVFHKLLTNGASHGEPGQ
jgi:hypothetical protein